MDFNAEIADVVGQCLEQSRQQLRTWLDSQHPQSGRDILVPYQHKYSSTKTIYVLMPESRRVYALNAQGERIPDRWPLYPSLEEAQETYPWIEIDSLPLASHSI